ncbi:MAG: DNA repair protein RadA [SAR324 cluster bacterium]|nr:DNA repair protein RadA [SAR324 cluster bacterium]
MAKALARYACTSCGARFPKWLGRCPECGEWNTVAEEAQPAAELGSAMAHADPSPVVSLRDVGGEAREARISTGLSELDRVLGGGFLPRSVTLLGGDPGIGKSTLVLQILDHIGRAGRKTLYITGEESAGQIKSRADRLGLSGAGIQIVTEVELERMIPAMVQEAPDLTVIDSIQTVRSGEIDSAAGSLSQVRACAARLIHHAKQVQPHPPQAGGTAMLLIGHVTKEGALAGPRSLEHMVDVVLYLEGDGDRPQRVLRSVKNRFGAINEIGLFRMTGKGLAEVSNPSALFLQERITDAPGTVVFAGMEGTRPLLIEIQALVGENALAHPRKTAAGVDPNRVALLQAVIEKHLGASLSGLDIYLNVVGGLRLSEPALDAAAVAAVLSSFHNRPIDPRTVVFGEVGLTGELRGVNFARERLAEAARLGFRRAVIPEHNRKTQETRPDGLEVIGAAKVAELAAALLP